MNIDFPFRIDGRKRTASTSNEDHVRDLIEQLLFTAPGERVNRPTFGSGLPQMIFGPNTPEMAAAVQFLIQGALQQYLADLIQVSSVQVDAIDSTLRVQVDYVLTRTQERRTTQLTAGA
jgi:phage baseplate assembly protein W